MTGYLIKMFMVSLVLTIVIELAVAFLFSRAKSQTNRIDFVPCLKPTWGWRGHIANAVRAGEIVNAVEDGGAPQTENRENEKNSRFALFGTKKGALLVILVNVLTNPAAVLLSQLGKRYLWAVPGIVTELFLEALVVAVEACIYRSFAKSPGWRIDRPVRLAVTANVCSWLTGVMIQKL